MFGRHLTPVLLEVAETMPVVTLLGPRQSGKTTLVRHAFPDHQYVSLEQPDVRMAAIEDPRGFLAEAEGGAILDEIHRAPNLLSYLQVDVDEDDRPGRYILTASQNLLLMEKVSQTLAGRTALLRLLPLSLGELCGWPAKDPTAWHRARPVESPPERELWETLFAGFYPRIHDKGLSPTRWLADYVRTYVERDLRDVLKVMDLDGFERFLRLAAGRTARELNLSSLASDVGITQPTAKAWLSALRVGSIVTVLPPHHANFSKRLRKRPKLHFLDTGLVCYLLGIRDPETLRRHPLRGAVFESFVVSELVKTFEHAGEEAPLFFWKDATGHEIDVLLDLGLHLVPVEAKSGMTVANDAFAGLRWWLDLPGNPNRAGLIVYGGAEPSRRPGTFVRPWFSA
ncbi:ATP-binding protein [Planctomycetota bacterium]